MEFIVNDEAVINDNGFVLLCDGAKLKRYHSNPCMLFDHNPTKVIGRWENLHVDDGKMYLTPVFDEDDPESKQIKGKVDRGFLRGASLGLIPLKAEYRSSPDNGEVLYITEWEWLECSICAIPSNANSLHIYDHDRTPVDKENLSVYLDHVVQLSTGERNNINLKIKQQMPITLSSQTYEDLGISANGADTVMVEKAVRKLSSKAKELEKELKEIKDNQAKEMRLRAESLVEKAVSDGKITADKKEKYIQLAMNDMEVATEVLDTLPGKQTYADKIHEGNAPVALERLSWTASDWMKNDMPGLMKLKTENQDFYKKLFNNK